MPRLRTPSAPVRPKNRTVTLSDVGVLTLTVDGAATDYWCDKLASDYGRAFTLRKFVGDGGETYNVLLSDDGKGDSCECKGHTYRGRCKHVDALRSLVAADRLPGYLTK